MKRKILYILLIIVVFLSMFSIHAYAAGEEDFTTYTEVDGSSSVTVTSDTVSWSSEPRGATNYVYKDFGEDYFSGDFSIDFEIEVTSSTSGDDGVLFMGVTNGYGVKRTFTYLASIDGIIVCNTHPSSPSEIRLFLCEVSNGVAYSSTNYVLTAGTEVFCTLTRDESVGTYGQASLYIYSDSDRTNHLTTLQLTLHEKEDFRYIMPHASYGSAGTYYFSGYTKDVLISGVGVPTIETIESYTIEYDPVSENYYANLSANLTNLGDGGLVWCKMFYREKDSTDEYTEYTYFGAFDTTEVVNFHIPFSVGNYGKEYEYYAYAVNSEGSDTGTEYYFTLEMTTLTTPIVHTSDYMSGFESVSDNNTITGTIWNDGGENCTGWFEFWKYGTANVTTSSNTTELNVINRSFTYDLIIEEDILYCYRAVAMNTQGTDYGNTCYIIWFNQSMPSCDTNVPYDIEESYPEDTYTITFSGNVTNDGGGECVVGFDYCEAGNEDIYTRIELGGSYVTGETFSYIMYGFQPNTNYSVRAIISNQAGYEPIHELYTYSTGDWITFATGSTVNIPTLLLTSVDYWDNYTVSCDITLTNDGGSQCYLNMQYRQRYTGIWTNATTPNITNATSPNEYTTYITGLSYGTEYEFRAYAYNNINGGFGYSNVVVKQLVSTTDTTTEPPSDIVTPITNWLSGIGFNNPIGKFIITIIVMFVAFALIMSYSLINKQYLGLSLLITAMFEAVIMGLAMMLDFIPKEIIIIMVIIFAVIGATFIIKILKAKGTEVE